MKSFKRMVVVSSLLLCGLLLAVNYAEHLCGGSGAMQAKTNTANMVVFAEPGYSGLITGIQLQPFH